MVQILTPVAAAALLFAFASASSGISSKRSDARRIESKKDYAKRPDPMSVRARGNIYEALTDILETRGQGTSKLASSRQIQLSRHETFLVESQKLVNSAGPSVKRSTRRSRSFERNPSTSESRIVIPSAPFNPVPLYVGLGHEEFNFESPTEFLADAQKLLKTAESLANVEGKTTIRARTRLENGIRISESGAPPIHSKNTNDTLQAPIPGSSSSYHEFPAFEPTKSRQITKTPSPRDGKVNRKNRNFQNLRIDTSKLRRISCEEI